jgi:hypothetical protein
VSRATKVAVRVSFRQPDASSREASLDVNPLAAGDGNDPGAVGSRLVTCAQYGRLKPADVGGEWELIERIHQRRRSVSGLVPHELQRCAVQARDRELVALGEIDLDHLDVVTFQLLDDRR